MKAGSKDQRRPAVAIACGGTGGHLFPGLAVAQALLKRGCEVCLIISEKEVDRQAVKDVEGIRILSLPGVGLTSGKCLAFVSGFGSSVLKSARFFKGFRPDAVLAMGGFTSAPPVLAGRFFGASAFLHESNSIPGKANRWLSRLANTSFVGFPAAGERLRSRRKVAIGTPVRSEFFSLEPAACRRALGLDPKAPVILVTGGSQGAEAINHLIARSASALKQSLPGCQWLHLTGSGKAEQVRQAYSQAGLNASVIEFLSRMDLALGAATAAVSRAGASSLAEIAAARLPAVLIPYPAAADNHQHYNAKAYSDCGAAFLLEQKNASPETLAGLLKRIAFDAAGRERMRANLAKWQVPTAADDIAREILNERGFYELGGAGRSGSCSSAAAENGAALEALFAREPAIYNREGSA